MEVPLARAVGPGETVNVQIAWSARVPRTFARTGTIGDFYFVGQWFPKIGVLEDTGWNTHQFHSGTEFFADFGTYDVRLTVPKGWVVGATGVERERRDEPDGLTTTHRYLQDDVHDFAWTTSPHFLDRHATFAEGGLPPVDIRLLLQPEHADQADRHFTAARATLKNYGQWFGPYPYGHLTIVDPAWQSGASGMEYATLITAGSRWLTPADTNVPEGVVVHEAGHQFWQGLVATNEFEHAWMDEGFNTYSTARVAEQAFGRTYYTKRYFGDFIPWVFRDLPLSRVIEGDRMPTYRRNATGDPAATETWRAYSEAAGAISYAKTALWLHTLERMVGWPMQQRILSTYFSRWEFRHPKPDDFFAVASEVSGRDLTSFFDQVYRGSGVFDYSVQSLTSQPNVARGYFGDGASRRFAASEGKAGEYITTVVVRRLGDGIFPVDVRLVLDNKEEIRWPWDGRDRSKTFQVVKPSRASFAQVDPEHVLLLDVNYTNNSASLAPQAGRRRAQVVSHLAGLAAGPPPHVRVLRLMPVMSAFRDGARRVRGAPMMLLGLFAVTLLMALPLSYVLRTMIADHLGASLAANAAAAGANYEWWQEFLSQASGLGKTFVPSIIGFGAVLDNLNGLLDNLPLASAILGITAVWLIVWSFLSGGIVDRLARGRRTRSHGFFAACGMHFWRLLRLGALAWLAYGFLFRYVHGWIFTGILAPAHARRDGRAHRVRIPCRRVSRVRRPARRRQRDFRLRPHPSRRRGSAECDRRAPRSGTLRAAPRRRSCWPLCAECLSIPPTHPDLRAPGSRSSRRQAVVGGGTCDRGGLHPGEALSEAAFLCVRNGALPGCARACGVYCSARGRVAGLTGSGEHRERGPFAGLLTVSRHNGPTDLQERTHPHRRRRTGEHRAAPAAAPACRVQPDREYD